MFVITDVDGKKEVEKLSRCVECGEVQLTFSHGTPVMLYHYLCAESAAHENPSSITWH